MSEEAAETAPDTPTTEAAAPEVDWKAKSREWEKRAKANADAARRLAEIEESQKSEAQRAQEALAAAQSEAEKAKSEALRWRVGVAAGLPADAIGRLQGATEEELAADAQQLASLLAPQRPPGRPVEQLQTTASGPEPAPQDVDAWIRSHAHRK